MVKLNMTEKKELSLVRVVGITAAAALIIFGSFQNFWRTVRFWWERIDG